LASKQGSYDDMLKLADGGSKKEDHVLSLVQIPTCPYNKNCHYAHSQLLKYSPLMYMDILTRDGQKGRIGHEGENAMGIPLLVIKPIV